MTAIGRAWIVAACLGPAIALAQDVEVEVDEQGRPVGVVAERRDRDWTVAGQAGVLAFTGEAARLTTPGPLYGVALGVDVTGGVNFELGYQGSTYKTEAAATGGESGIVQNGAQALVSLGPELENNFFPFAQFGFQVSRLNVLRNVEEVRDATMVWLPMGVGVSYSIPSESAAEISVGARGTYNFTLDSGAFPTVAEPAAANQLTSSLLVGGRF